MKKHLFSRGSAIVMIFVLALLLRLGGMLLSPLGYDELWSLENFSQQSMFQVFTDLSLPNNHPLNSLFIRLFVLAGFPALLIRLHSLVFGMISVAFTGVLARGLFHHRNAAVWSMFFLAFCAPAISYSQQARGYSAQLCFLLLFSCGVVWGGGLRRFCRWRYLPEAAIVVGGVGAMLCVPSAPVFLGAVGVCALAFSRGERREGSVVIALSVTAALVLAYLGWNYHDLRLAQKWGVVLDSWSDWELFIGLILSHLVAYTYLPLIVVAGKYDRRRSLLLFLCLALVIGSAAVVKAGPPRVYLPLCVIIALLSGRGAQLALFLAKNRYGKKVVSLAMLLVVLLGYYGYLQLEPKWRVTDYWHWFSSARLEPETTIVVYPATEGYPLVWNNQPDASQDHYRRLSCSVPGERTLLVFAAPGVINGIDREGAERIHELSFAGTRIVLGGREGWSCRLLPVDGTPASGSALIIVLPPAAPAEMALLFGGLNERGIGYLSLNPFFNRELTAPSGVRRGRLLFATAPAAETDWDFVRASGARMYVVQPPPAPVSAAKTVK